MEGLSDEENVLQDFHKGLLAMRFIDTTKKDVVFYKVFYLLHMVFLDQVKNRTLATEDQFKMNVRFVKREQFLEIFRKAVKSPLNREDLEALMFHGMCFTLVWIRPIRPIRS